MSDLPAVKRKKRHFFRPRDDLLMVQTVLSERDIFCLGRARRVAAWDVITDTLNRQGISATNHTLRCRFSRLVEAFQNALFQGKEPEDFTALEQLLDQYSQAEAHFEESRLASKQKHGQEPTAQYRRLSIDDRRNSDSDTADESVQPVATRLESPDTNEIRKKRFYFKEKHDVILLKAALGDEGITRPSGTKKPAWKRILAVVNSQGVDVNAHSIRTHLRLMVKTHRREEITWDMNQFELSERQKLLRAYCKKLDEEAHNNGNDGQSFESIVADQSFERSTEDQSFNPTTGTHSIEPTSEGQSFNPTTGTQSIEPSSEGQSFNPTTGTQSIEPSSATHSFEPTAKAQSYEPTTHDQPFEPTSEVQSIEPTTEDHSVEPNTRAKTVKPTTEGQSIEPTTEGQSIESTTEDQSVEPTTEDQSVEPTIGDQPFEPTVEDESFESTTKEHSFEPTTEVQSIEPRTEDQPFEPTIDDQSIEPTTEDQLFESTSDDQLIEPRTEDQSVEPTTEDQSFEATIEDHVESNDESDDRHTGSNSPQMVELSAESSERARNDIITELPGSFLSTDEEDIVIVSGASISRTQEDVTTSSATPATVRFALGTENAFIIQNPGDITNRIRVSNTTSTMSNYRIETGQDIEDREIAEPPSKRQKLRQQTIPERFITEQNEHQQEHHEHERARSNEQQEMQRQTIDLQQRSLDIQEKAMHMQERLMALMEKVMDKLG